MSHSILLVQPNKRQDSRSYADFESVNEAMEGICKIYEEQLKKAEFCRNFHNWQKISQKNKISKIFCLNILLGFIISRKIFQKLWQKENPDHQSITYDIR